MVRCCTTAPGVASNPDQRSPEHVACARLGVQRRAVFGVSRTTCLGADWSEHGAQETTAVLIVVEHGVVADCRDGHPHCRAFVGRRPQPEGTAVRGAADPAGHGLHGLAGLRRFTEHRGAGPAKCRHAPPGYGRGVAVRHPGALRLPAGAARNHARGDGTAGPPRRPRLARSGQPLAGAHQRHRRRGHALRAGCAGQRAGRRRLGPAGDDRGAQLQLPALHEGRPGRWPWAFLRHRRHQPYPGLLLVVCAAQRQEHPGRGHRQGQPGGGRARHRPGSGDDRQAGRPCPARCWWPTSAAWSSSPPTRPGSSAH